MDTAVRGVDYCATVDRYMKHVNVSSFSGLGPRDLDVVRRFRDFSFVINHFSRSLYRLTDWTARDALANLTFDDPDLWEITVISGWVLRLVHMCVREGWWRTLECAVTIYDLRGHGVQIDPEIAPLLQEAYRNGFDPAPEW